MIEPEPVTMAAAVYFPALAGAKKDDIELSATARTSSCAVPLSSCHPQRRRESARLRAGLFGDILQLSGIEPYAAAIDAAVQLNTF